MSRRWIVLLCMCLLFAFMSFAETRTWSGGGAEGDWYDSANWAEGSAPTPNDDVVVPESAPPMTLPSDMTAEARSFTVNGQINSGGGYIKTGNFTCNSSGSVSLSEGGLTIVQQNDTNPLRMENNGDISGTAGGFGVIGDGVIANYGTIEAQRIGLQGNVVHNDSGASITSIQNMEIKGNVDVRNDGNVSTTNDGGTSFITVKSANGSITNNGNIFTGDNSASVGSPTGGVTISAKQNLNNTGNISTGDNATFWGSGRITVFCKRLNNTGKMQPGDANGDVGDIEIWAKRRCHFYDGQGLIGGYFLGRDHDTLSSLITVRSDTIDVRTKIDTDYIINLSGNYINMDVESLFCVWGTYGVNFYNTPTGTLNFSDIEHEQVIAAGWGNINLYSNNVIPPAILTLDDIFVPSYSILPPVTDNSYGFIMVEEAIDWGGESGNIQIWAANMSLSDKTLNYTVSSSRGWLTTTTGSFPSIEPFGDDSLDIPYTIPLGTVEGTIDTITAILTIAPDFADTSIATIFCLAESLVLGIDGDDIPTPDAFEISAYPNPFNSAISISAPDNTVVEVFDIEGRKIDELPGGEQIWKPEPSAGSGIYLVRARFDSAQRPCEEEITKRVVYLK